MTHRDSAALLVLATCALISCTHDVPAHAQPTPMAAAAPTAPAAPVDNEMPVVTAATVDEDPREPRVMPLAVGARSKLSTLSAIWGAHGLDQSRYAANILVTPDSKRVVVGSIDGEVLVIDARSRAVLLRFVAERWLGLGGVALLKGDVIVTATGSWGLNDSDALHLWSIDEHGARPVT